MHNYLECLLVVLLHACFSVVGPIPCVLAAMFFPGYTVLPDLVFEGKRMPVAGCIVYINIALMLLVKFTSQKRHLLSFTDGRCRC